MLIIQWGGGLFLGFLLFHLLFWRLHKPESPIKVLLVIFLAVASVGLATQYLCSSTMHLLGLAGLPNLAAHLHVVLVFISMTFSYIVCYTVLEWDSPTLTIVMMITSAGKDGIEEADLIKRVEQLPFLESRMQDLMRSGILLEKGGRYFLSPGHHLFYRSILFYNRLLRADLRSG